MIRILTILVLAALGFGAANAQTLAAAPIQNPFGRAHQDLGGKWEVIVDVAQIGSVSPFAGFPPVDFPSAKPWTNDMVLQEWRFDPKVQLSVPGDWNSQQERLFFYEGDVWYHRAIQAAPKEGRRAILYFGAANYRADVYLNGQPLGFHEGGFTPFQFDVTERLKGGANSLVVRVRNTLGPATVPTRFTDWHNYGGLTREVLLIDTPTNHVADYRIALIDLARRTVSASVQLAQPKGGVAVSIALPALKETARAITDADGRAVLTWRTRAKLWSPESPTLYDIEVRAGEDIVRDRVGLRAIAVAGEDIVLNGRPIFLKGVSAHEETTQRPGRAYGPLEARAMLSEIKVLNGNFIRLAHYPHNEHVVRMADEMGVLVWSELPLYWGIDWANPATLANAEAQARAMVARDRNRASVVLWSLANETPPTPERLAFLRRIAEVVRAEDASRPLTAALFGDPRKFVSTFAKVIAARLALDPAITAEQRSQLRAWLAQHPAAAGRALDEALLRQWALERVPVIIDDPLAAAIDVVGFNQYFGWYYEAPIARIIPASEAQVRAQSLALLPQIDIRTVARRPLVISEFGADALYGLEGPDTAVFSEAFQARYYRQQIAMIATIPNLRGVSPWVLKDFRSPRRTLPGVLDYWNRKGLIDEQGRRKQAFSVLAEAYGPAGAFGGR